ncbi:MAG: DUF805 domain-containing protein [Methylacidiphilales bacterium]|nr:DUF805 domain-containing protein [Candidatus Methylacidiphilales bacterium]
MFHDGTLPLVNKIALLIALTFLLPLLLVDFATTVRRCSDADINPWWVITMYIPYFDLGLFAYIVIGSLPSVKKTTEEESI